MCLILFRWQDHGRYRLALAANRDEFFERPTAPAAFWAVEPGLLAGRDLRSGGSWMGVTRGGRVAAVTNYRDPARIRAESASRGDLVTGFLLGAESPQGYALRVHRDGARYNPFSLLVADASTMWFCTNEGPQPFEVTPGVHGLSNHLLDTPWPKVARGRAALPSALERADDVEALFSLLADRSRAPDETLPSTGVGLERERVLSSMFISTDDYGTRCSTVLLIDHRGEVTFVERTFAPSGETTHAGDFRFRIES